ncbi:MAG: hypothetical protein WD733_04830 [Bryobacterales bacterium]
MERTLPALPTALPTVTVPIHVSAKETAAVAIRTLLGPKTHRQDCLCY